MSSTIPVIGAGAVLKVGDGGTPTEVFAEVPGCVNIGEIGAKGEFVETTPISALVREYIAGMETPPDLSFTFNDLTGNTAQQDFLDQAAARETVNMEVEYPNGRVARMTVVLAGYTVSNPESGKAIQVVVFAKQSGAATFTIT